MELLKDAFIQKLINNGKSTIIIITPNKLNPERGDSLKQAFETRIAKLLEQVRKLKAEKKSSQTSYAPQKQYSMSDFFATMG